MLRGLLALLVGLFAAVIVMTFAAGAASKLWPPPAGIDTASVAQLAEVMAAMPLAEKLAIVAGWLAAAFAGGLVTTLAARHATAFALVPGVLLGAGTLANALKVPHPLWMAAAGVLLVVPMAWLGGRVGVRFVRAKDLGGEAWKGYDR
jgi:hypothetical protein